MQAWRILAAGDFAPLDFSGRSPLFSIRIKVKPRSWRVFGIYCMDDFLFGAGYVDWFG